MKTAMNALLHVTIVDGSSDSFLVTFRILSRLNGIVDSENLDYGLSIRSPLPKDKFFVVNFFLSIQNTFYVHGASIKLFQAPIKRKASRLRIFYRLWLLTKRGSHDRFSIRTKPRAAFLVCRDDEWHYLFASRLVRHVSPRVSK